jgi:hypothetical protein
MDGVYVPLIKGATPASLAYVVNRLGVSLKGKECLENINISRAGCMMEGSLSFLVHNVGIHALLEQGGYHISMSLEGSGMERSPTCVVDSCIQRQSAVS